jgi:hypothetical protein
MQTYGYPLLYGAFLATPGSQASQSPNVGQASGDGRILIEKTGHGEVSSMEANSKSRVNAQCTLVQSRGGL